MAGRRSTAWSIALEFLPAAGVISVKTVSKELRGAARLVLTRGRYRPVTRCLELVSRLGAPKSAHLFREDCRSLPEGSILNVRGAWLLEPSFVVEAILYAEFNTTRLTEWALPIFEPSSDGLERVIAAMEHVKWQQKRVDQFFELDFRRWLAFVGRIVEPNGPPAHLRIFRLPDGYLKRAEARLFQALQHWSCPHRAFLAAFAYSRDDFREESTDPDEFFESVETMTSTWVDQVKRTVFLGYFRDAADEELEDRDEAASEYVFLDTEVRH